jgi:2-desacetyl-2-hydroxyethyl bacteriochlorophyllide A dehydrogenase
MRVAMWHGGSEFTVEDAPDPSPGSDDVIVEVDSVGICGTDVHITQGLFPSTPPAVLGHEFSGRIVAVGSGVNRNRIGEEVACDISTHCFECVECLDGRWNRCEKARPSSGAFAEFAIVPASSATPIPEGLTLEHGALTEPASCCLSGMELAGVKEGDTALVIGGGAMGLFSLAFAKKLGAGTAILSDPIAERREMAKQLGADIVHDPAQGPLRDLVHEVTGGRGVHVSCEAVGKPALVREALDSTRPRGTLLLIGVSPRGTRLPIDLYDFQWREVAIRGAFGRGMAFARTPDALAELNLDGMISCRYPLGGVADGIDATGRGIGVKTLVKPRMVE